MFGSEILEIAIGLTFIYLLLSLVVTSITEIVARVFSLRANNLYKGIGNLLKETGADAFYKTAIIQSLTKPVKGKRPGYISAQRFYDGLFQVLDPANGLDGTSAKLKTTIDEGKQAVEKINSSSAIPLGWKG